jgi:hypothetical protein
MIFDLAVMIILNTLKSVIKNPAKKEQYRMKLLVIRDMIDMLFAEETIEE